MNKTATKLERIQRHLYRRDDIVVFKKEPITTSPDHIHVSFGDSLRSHPIVMQTVTFKVAPKEGIFRLEELQRLMLTLPPEGMPFSARNFARCDDGKIHIGELRFAEVIGHFTKQEVRTIVLEDEEARAQVLRKDDFLFRFQGPEENTASFAEGSENPLMRMIVVAVYPHRDVAEDGAGVIDFAKLYRKQC